MLMTSCPPAKTDIQRQLDALADFCEEWQLTVNLSKTKVVIFEPQSLAAKVFSSTV